MTNSLKWQYYSSASFIANIIVISQKSYWQNVDIDENDSVVEGHLWNRLIGKIQWCTTLSSFSIIDLKFIETDLFIWILPFISIRITWIIWTKKNKIKRQRSGEQMVIFDNFVACIVSFNRQFSYGFLLWLFPWDLTFRLVLSGFDLIWFDLRIACSFYITFYMLIIIFIRPHLSPI